MSFTLRPYQTSVIEKVRDSLRRGNKRVMMYSATGSGKTEIAMSIIQAAVDKGKRVIFAVNRIELSKQASRRFFKSNIAHGIIQGQNTTGVHNQVLVCSIQTLAKRGIPEGTDLLVIDEAHGATAQAYRDLIAKSGCPVIGLSATPFTKGLGKHDDAIGGPLFEDLVVACTIAELIEYGFLVDVEIYAPSEPNLKGVKITAGDYNEKQLGERVDRKELIGDIVEQWKKLAGGVRTVCFATNIAHSEHIRDEFRKAGIRCEHIDCFTEDAERTRILFALQDGEIDVVTNVSVLAEGWDCAPVECMILARPTRSLTRYIQMAGRILRPANGKTRGLMLDHSGSCARLGFPTDDLPLELDDGTKPKPTAKEEEERIEQMPKACPACHYMIPVGAKACPKCGHEVKRKMEVVSKAGELVKLKKATTAEKQDVYSQLKHIAEQRRKSDGWVAHSYKAWFGVWPRGLNESKTPPTKAVQDFVTSRAIAYAKSMEKSSTAKMATEEISAATAAAKEIVSTKVDWKTEALRA